ncbi:hypothetical protein GCM10022199_27190 [Marihabitans asiaticum]
MPADLPVALQQRAEELAVEIGGRVRLHRRQAEQGQAQVDGGQLGWGWVHVITLARMGRRVEGVRRAGEGDSLHVCRPATRPTSPATTQYWS